MKTSSNSLSRGSADSSLRAAVFCLGSNPESILVQQEADGCQLHDAAKFSMPKIRLQVGPARTFFSQVARPSPDKNTSQLAEVKYVTAPIVPLRPSDRHVADLFVTDLGR